jgi:hypothetical protein
MGDVKWRLGRLARCLVLPAAACLMSGAAFAQCNPSLPLASGSVPCFVTVQPIDVCSCSAFTGTTCTGTKSCAPFNTTSTTGVGSPTNACTQASQTLASCTNPIGFVVNPATGLSPGQTGYSSGSGGVDVTRMLLMQGGVDMVLNNMEEYDSPNGVTVSGGNYQTLTVTQTANPVATCTGGIAGTVLTITSCSSGSQPLAVFDALSGGTIAANTTIAGFGTGSGGAGTYLVTPSQTVASTTITVSVPVQQSQDFLNLAQQVPSPTTNNPPLTQPCAINQMTIPPGSNGNPCGAPSFPRNTDPGVINLFFVNTFVPPGGTGFLYGFSYIGNNGVAIAEDTFGYPRSRSSTTRPDTMAHEFWHDLGLRHVGFAAGPFTPPNGPNGSYVAPEGVVLPVPATPLPLECDASYPACAANLLTTGSSRTPPMLQCMFFSGAGTLPTGCTTSSPTFLKGEADQLTLATQENSNDLPESQQRVVLTGGSGLLDTSIQSGFLNPIPHVTTKASLEPGDGPADRAVFDLSDLTDGRPGETLVAWILTLPQEQTFAGHSPFHIIAQSRKDLVQAVDYYPDAANNPLTRDIAYRSDTGNIPSNPGLGAEADSPCATAMAECLMVKFQQTGLGTKDSITFSKDILIGGAPVTKDDLCKAKITYIFSDGYATTSRLGRCPAVSLPLISSSWRPDPTVSPRKVKSNVLLAQATSQNATLIGAAYLNNAASSNAVIGFSHGPPDVTFSVPSPNPACTGVFAGDTLCFNSNASANAYTLGGFLASGGATVLTGSAAALAANLDNTVFEFTGTVTVTGTVTSPEMFQAGHDDGLTLTIGNVTVISAPGPTAFTTTPATYNGPPGTFPFDLVYGECCGPPAVLGISLPLVTPTLPCTPDPNNPGQCQATPATQGLVDADPRQEGGANLQSCDNGATSGTGSGSGIISGRNVTVSAGQTCNFISPCEIQGGLTIDGGTVYLNCTLDGNLTMTGGSLNLGPSAHLLGNVQMAQAISFNIGPNVEVDGGLQINTAAGPGTVCSTQVKGNVSMQNNQAAIQIGAAPQTNCSANTIGGHLQCTGNKPVPSGSNTVGGGSNHCTN